MFGGFGMNDNLKELTENKFIQEMLDIRINPNSDERQYILYCLAMGIGFIGGLIVGGLE